jgi:hypothetical protein
LEARQAACQWLEHAVDTAHHQALDAVASYKTRVAVKRPELSNATMGKIMLANRYARGYTCNMCQNHGRTHGYPVTVYADRGGPS